MLSSHLLHRLGSFLSCILLALFLQACTSDGIGAPTVDEPQVGKTTLAIDEETTLVFTLRYGDGEVIVNKEFEVVVTDEAALQAAADRVTAIQVSPVGRVRTNGRGQIQHTVRGISPGRAVVAIRRIDGTPLAGNSRVTFTVQASDDLTVAFSLRPPVKVDGSQEGIVFTQLKKITPQGTSATFSSNGGILFVSDTRAESETLTIDTPDNGIIEVPAKIAITAGADFDVTVVIKDKASNTVLAQQIVRVKLPVPVVQSIGRPSNRIIGSLLEDITPNFTQHVRFNGVPVQNFPVLAKIVVPAGQAQAVKILDGINQVDEKTFTTNTLGILASSLKPIATGDNVLAFLNPSDGSSLGALQVTVKAGSAANAVVFGGSAEVPPNTTLSVLVTIEDDTSGNYTNIEVIGGDGSSQVVEAEPSPGEPIKFVVVPVNGGGNPGKKIITVRIPPPVNEEIIIPINVVPGVATLADIQPFDRTFGVAVVSTEIPTFVAGFVDVTNGPGKEFVLVNTDEAILSASNSIFNPNSVTTAFGRAQAGYVVPGTAGAGTVTVDFDTGQDSQAVSVVQQGLTVTVGATSFSNGSYQLLAHVVNPQTGDPVVGATIDWGLEALPPALGDALVKSKQFTLGNQSTHVVTASCIDNPLIDFSKFVSLGAAQSVTDANGVASTTISFDRSKGDGAAFMLTATLVSGSAGGYGNVVIFTRPDSGDSPLGTDGGCVFVPN